jgi:hypothetical protein
MKTASKQFLDRAITRRTFVSRITRSGVAATAASRLATSLDLAAQAPGAASPGRVVSDLTGGELMAECLIDWGGRRLRPRRIGGSWLLTPWSIVFPSLRPRAARELGRAMADGCACVGQRGLRQRPRGRGTAYALGRSSTRSTIACRSS